MIILTRRITELSLTIESEWKNQAELALMNATLDLLTIGIADISPNCEDDIVDLGDFAEFAKHWLYTLY